DPNGALTLRQELVLRLGRDRTQSDSLAEAYYRLGILEEEAASRLRLGDPLRRTRELRSKQAYESALTLAPLSQRYLIAAGSQELNLGDLDAAQRDYVRAHNADPTSAVAFVGLGEVALRRGDAAGARAALARAHALDPNEPSVSRLAHKLAK
ncbi:MAG: tetratricopeptide repeat protein, partial [Vulcanimicrobiaceae bacterium]